MPRSIRWISTSLKLALLGFCIASTLLIAGLSAQTSNVRSDGKYYAQNITEERFKNLSDRKKKERAAGERKRKKLSDRKRKERPSGDTKRK